MNNISVLEEKISGLKKGSSTLEVLERLKSKEISQNVTDKLLIVLLDCSDSMRDNMGSSSKIKTAWKVFQTNLAPNLSNWKYGILTFSNLVKWYIFTGSTPDTITKWNMPEPGGLTSLGEALIVAWKHIADHYAGARIILLTDGEPTDMPKSSILNMATLHSTIPIDTVAVGKDIDYDPVFLKKLSEITGGVFCEANSANNLADIITRLSPVQRPLLGVSK